MGEETRDGRRLSPTAKQVSVVGHVRTLMCILNRADNNKIKRQRPSEYKALMPTDGLDAILSSAVTTKTLYTDDFEAFREERAALLADIAEGLVA